MSQRKPIVAANWKMNMLRRDAETFCDALRQPLATDPGAEVLLFPPATLLGAVSRGLAGTVAASGGQDLHPAASGAHTGDLSGPQLTDSGATWVLCGHSERRQDHRESDDLVGAKAKAANEHGLVPLICLGESGEERRAGKTFEVLARQLTAALAPRPASFEIAYEPVWAIGTGETATPEQAQEAHAFLRRALVEVVGKERAASTRLLYGGSVKPENASDLIAQADLDGFLVGGASLDVEKFLAIIMSCGASA